MTKAAFQTCSRCGTSLGASEFLPTKNKFYPNKLAPMCNKCLVSLIKLEDEDESEIKWNAVDKICQLLDIPFIPIKWQELYEKQGAAAIVPYSRIFAEADYRTINWHEQEEIYLELRDAGQLTEAVVPRYTEAQLDTMRAKWGANYDEEELAYLEELYNGVIATQSINGALQMDQALKLCKLSLTIDSRIREGQDIDKLLASYEKLVKVAEFTPKNVKNAEDFDSVGELFAWLEKRGFVNKFYDGATRDIVDVTMKNIQQFNQRLYTQESGIGEDINKRIEQLSMAKSIEDNMGLLDDYTNDDVADEIDENFNAEFEVSV